MKPTLFGLKNLASETVRPVLPWEYENGSMPAGMSKEQYSAWGSNPATDSMFFSGFEGSNAALRVSVSNPPVRMHALVADYDSVVSPEERANVAQRARSYLPNYLGRSFSGGVRAIWLFEAPIFAYGRALTGEFLKKLKKELKLGKLFPGLDEGAILQPGQYYQVGSEWQAVNPKPLPSALLEAWILDITEKATWSGCGEDVPIERVAAEVKKMFPGRWPGQFQLGARGPRFWDPSADNPTAAIVRSSGMQCFTGPKPFVVWGEILGREFMDKFSAETVGAAIEGVWFDGRDYWRRVSGVWRCFKKDDLNLHLRVEGGIHDERPVGSCVSQIDRVFHQIHERQSVDGAAPFVFVREQTVMQDAKRYLNIARPQLLLPAEKPQRWGQDFHWLADFFDGLFDPGEQLDYFLSWLAYAYQRAHAGAPRNGQVVFLAGEVNQGKTFLSTGLLGKLFGGYADASDYLLGESKFNKELFEVGLWSVDDTLPSSDPKKQRLYTAMLKKIPANYAFLYHAKFRDQIMLTWAGRVIVTCNADPESIRILPDTEMSLLDKVCLFMVKTKARDFTGAAEALRVELPFFARFLLDYKIPGACRGDSRFGVKCYHHPDLLEEARQSGRTAGFAELLEAFRDAYFKEMGRQEWCGNATQLKQTMLGDMTLKPLIEEYSVDTLGRLLGKLVNENYPGLVRLPRTGATRRWRLARAAEANMMCEVSCVTKTVTTPKAEKQEKTEDGDACDGVTLGSNTLLPPPAVQDAEELPHILFNQVSLESQVSQSGSNTGDSSHDACPCPLEASPT